MVISMRLLAYWYLRLWTGHGGQRLEAEYRPSGKGHDRQAGHRPLVPWEQNMGL